MRVSYFGYTLRHKTTGQSVLVDLRDFVSGFARWKNATFKSKLKYNDEQLFLLPYAPPVYLFVQARDREIIKAIEKQQISVRDIQSALNGDSVGFASYILFDKHWLGIGCRVLSPRITAFADFMRQILLELRVPYLFLPRALTESLPKDRVGKLHEVSSVSIEMSMSNPVASDVINLITGGSGVDIADVGSLEISIRRPRKGKRNLKGALKELVGTIPDSGLESLEVRARRQIAEHMTDVYIVGQGGLRDFISADSEASISDEMVSRARSNSTLAEKLVELRASDDLKTIVTPGSIQLDWKSARDLRKHTSKQ